MGRRVRKERPEAAEQGAFCRRVIRSLVRRADDGDTFALSELLAVRNEADAAIGRAARGLHDFGYSWGQIGAELGTTRQNAHKTYGREVAR